MDVPLIKDGQEQQDKLGLTQKKLCFFVNYQRSNCLPELSHLVSWDFPPQVFRRAPNEQAKTVVGPSLFLRQYLLYHQVRVLLFHLVKDFPDINFLPQVTPPSHTLLYLLLKLSMSFSRSQRLRRCVLIVNKNGDIMSVYIVSDYFGTCPHSQRQCLHHMSIVNNYADTQFSF